MWSPFSRWRTGGWEKGSGDEDRAGALAADLARAVQGEVRFDAAARALYATDASNFRQVPIGVVIPRDLDDVEAAVAVCRRHGAPLLSRGAGTSLAGQCCNVAVVLDWKRHVHGVSEIDPVARTARVLPGTVLDDLRRQAGEHGLTFGPDPATHAWCTVGGMLGNNSCGAHSLTTGRTSDNVLELTVLTYDGLRLTVGATDEDEIARLVRAGGRRGEIYRRLGALRDRYADLIRARFPKLRRRVSGYNLDELLEENGFHLARALVGSEGTCVTVLETKLRLTPAPKARALAVVGFESVVAAAEAVPAILELAPYGLEGMDRFLVDNEMVRRSYRQVLDSLPPGDAWLLVEMAGETAADAEDRAQQVAPGALVLTEASAQRAVWEVREAAVGTTARDPRLGRLGDGWPGWEDAAVPPERLAAYLRDFAGLLDRFGYGAALYGHFGEGCIHARIDFDFGSREGIAKYRAFLEAGTDLVVRYGGSISGEHGDGQQRGELLARMFGPELVSAFRDFKAIWDPDNRMNPGKVIDARPLDADLRPATVLASPQTVFAFSSDQGSFARAVTRCVGVGKCLRDDGGVMCPSYRATREEAHSTRGRSRLLFEMLAGEVLPAGFASEEVREALELCLACKACKSECPAGVDLATYKAEFLSRYYRGRPRPLSAHVLGRIDRWARLGSLVPRLANRLVSSSLLKQLVGIHAARHLPPLAPTTLRRWWRGRPRRREGKPLLLFADTFANFFHPEIGQAAVALLEDAGYAVSIRQEHLCCGRPLYDFGMLTQARKRLVEILAVLQPEIEAGTPVVVLEPSCGSVFRDELTNLIPGDERAVRLARQTQSLAEALLAAGWQGKGTGSVLLYPHCHQRAVVGFSVERELLTRAGFEVAVPDAGCCGMAGAFGFKRETYAVSKRCAELAVLPALRGVDSSTPIIADGFSCRLQIAQEAGREAVSLAQVLAQPAGRP